MSSRVRLLAPLMATVLVLLVPGFAAADDTGSTADELDALQDIPGLLASSKNARTRSDQDSAMSSNLIGASVDVPRDPTDGITVDPLQGPTIQLQIPTLESTQEAQAVAQGTIVYEGTDPEVDTAVQVQPPSKLQSGSVRTLTVISGPDAPSDYRFDVQVDDGGQIEENDGGFDILDAKGRVTAAIADPWAKDANGDAVGVHYSLDGNAVIMHVEHEGAAYPVTADPGIEILIIGEACATIARDLCGKVANKIKGVVTDAVSWLANSPRVKKCVAAAATSLYSSKASKNIKDRLMAAGMNCVMMAL